MSGLIGLGKLGTTKPSTECSCGQCTEQLVAVQIRTSVHVRGFSHLVFWD